MINIASCVRLIMVGEYHILVSLTHAKHGLCLLYPVEILNRYIIEERQCEHQFSFSDHMETSPMKPERARPWYWVLAVAYLLRQSMMILRENAELNTHAPRRLDQFESYNSWKAKCVSTVMWQANHCLPIVTVRTLNTAILIFLHFESMYYR